MRTRRNRLLATVWLAASSLFASCGGGGGASNPPAADFALLDPPSSAIETGADADVAVSVQRLHGHTAPIALSLAANAAGITGVGSVAGGASAGTLTVTVPDALALATYALTLNGSDGSLVRAAALDLSVIDELAIPGVSTLAVGSVGASYSMALVASGGVAPYSWSVVGGALPAGLTFDESGTFSGTATTAGDYDFSVQVADSGNLTLSKPLSMLVTAAYLPQLALNGSFEQGLANWMQLGAGVGVQYTVVADAVDGVNAVRVTNRSELTHAPGQNVFSSLLVDAAGTPLTTRFWVKLDAPGSARCSLNLTSDIGAGQFASSKLLLAERVVRSADTWTEVDGTTRLSWSGTLTAASLMFDIGQPVEGAFPSLTIDHLRIERDADADGLPDVDESAAAANDRDRDHDGLPDGWESAHLQVGVLDPDVADAQLDADADGSSNHEEYWGATDPLDGASQPGVPCVAGASAGVQAVVAGLALAPSLSEQRVVSGQHITGAPSLGGLAGEFASNVQALFDQTGMWPGVLSMQYEGADASIGPLQVDLVNAVASDWHAAGGVVLIKYQPFDPWTLAPNSSAGGAHVDLVGLLDPAAGDPANFAANVAANANWVDWLDQMATGLDQLQQAGIVVLWRPLSEMNNVSHWHSRQPRDAWIAVWRDMFDYFTNVRALQNLVWVYEGDSVAHAVVPSDYYYPGDDVVDLMGHNFYDDDWVLPYDLELLFRRYPKIYGFPQAGSQAIRDGSWDNRLMIEGIRERSPRASLFCTWNDFYSGGGVFNARSMVSQAFATELLEDPWVVTRDELDL